MPPTSRSAPTGYSLWGSSAGARMAASIGSHGAAAFGGADLPRPAAVVMAYTGHAEVTGDEPPTFVVVGEDDRIAPADRMERRVEALRASGTEVEFHRFDDLGHGFGPGIGTSAEGWIGEAVGFWERVTGSPRIDGASRTPDRPGHGVALSRLPVAPTAQGDK